MTHDEMLLLTELNRLCGEAAAFCLGFPDGNLPLVDEYAFGFRLLDLSHGILAHARERAPLAAGPAEPGPMRARLRREAVIEHGELPYPEANA